MAPLCKDPDMGAIGKPPETFQKQGNDLSPSVTFTQDPLNNYVSEINRELKVLAKELNIPITALSQLSRDIEHRSPPIPVLSDLRDSGSLEQDADLVIFIYRGDLYERTTGGVAKLIVAKQRNGPIGEVWMRFDGPCTRFEELADQGQGRQDRRGFP